jgi:hypothetical protein
MVCIGRKAIVMFVLTVCAWPTSAGAPDQPPGAASQYKAVKACSLLPVEEVKKIAPWEPVFDQMKPEEEALGTYGSSCEYPTVGVQVLRFRQDTIDALGKSAKLEAVSGIGDAAWARNNRDDFAELFVRVGEHLLTLQMGIRTGTTFESSKPTLLALGKAFAAKLR